MSRTFLSLFSPALPSALSPGRFSVPQMCSLFVSPWKIHIAVSSTTDPFSFWKWRNVIANSGSRGRSRAWNKHFKPSETAGTCGKSPHAALLLGWWCRLPCMGLGCRFLCLWQRWPVCPGFLWSQLRTGDLAPVLQKFKNLVDVAGLGHTCFSLFLVISDALVTQGCPACRPRATCGPGWL